MTRRREDPEQASIETFVERMIRDVRPKGTSAAVTHVLVAAAYAAANITTRTATGAIDDRIAHETFREAARLMQRRPAKAKAPR